MTSEAQILANQENARKSTGPKSLEGKAQSRLNATTHGLSRAGASITSYDPELVARRIAEWTAYRAPRTDRERWLVEQVALATVRIDYCRIEENALQTSTAQHASICWDEERRVDAEELGAKLHRNPALTVAKLKRTVQGCGWLSERWESLERIAATHDWNDSQRGLALDMLGVPPEFRENHDQLPDGPDTQALAKLARREIKKIEKAVARGMMVLDEEDQKMAIGGLTFIFSAGARLLRRYSAESMKIYWWAERELKACLKEPESASRNEPDPPPVTRFKEPESIFRNEPNFPPVTCPREPESIFRNEPNFPPVTRVETASPAPEPVEIEAQVTHEEARKPAERFTPAPKVYKNRRARKAAEARARSK